MKGIKSLFASVALLASFGATSTAGAQTWSLASGPIGVIRAFSGSAVCTAGAPCSLLGLATIVGGSVIQNDQPFADIPAGLVTDNRFLSAGPTSTGPAVMTFTQALPDINFLWGSPDLYNILTVFTTAGSSTFTPLSFPFPVTNGNQGFSQYITFTAAPGTLITGLSFASGTDAFEVANFNSTVPEPSTYALMGTGLLALGLASRRRQRA